MTFTPLWRWPLFAGNSVRMPKRRRSTKVSSHGECPRLRSCLDSPTCRSRGTADSERVSQRALHLFEAKCDRQYFANVPEEIPQRQKCLLVRSEGGSRSCRLVSSDDGFNGDEVSRYGAHN